MKGLVEAMFRSDAACRFRRPSPMTNADFSFSRRFAAAAGVDWAGRVPRQPSISGAPTLGVSVSLMLVAAHRRGGAGHEAPRAKMPSGVPGGSKKAASDPPRSWLYAPNTNTDRALAFERVGNPISAEQDFRTALAISAVPRGLCPPTPLCRTGCFRIGINDFNSLPHLEQDLRLPSKTVMWVKRSPSYRRTAAILPVAAKLFLSSETADADVFLALRLYDAEDKEVLFIGSNDPRVPVGLGWLRASHRKLDPARSTPYRPYHTHDEIQPLEPGQPVELDVEIWPTSIVVPMGYRIAVTVKGCDYDHGLGDAAVANAMYPMKGIGPFLHDIEEDRPRSIFGKRYTLHFNPGKEPYLLLPIIPQ